MPLSARKSSVLCVTTWADEATCQEPKRTLNLQVGCLRCSRFAPHSVELRNSGEIARDAKGARRKEKIVTAPVLRCLFGLLICVFALASENSAQDKPLKKINWGVTSLSG